MGEVYVVQRKCKKIIARVKVYNKKHKTTQ